MAVRRQAGFTSLRDDCLHEQYDFRAIRRNESAQDFEQFGDKNMRAETQVIVSEIKQSLELLRRHL